MQVALAGVKDVHVVDVDKELKAFDARLVSPLNVERIRAAALREVASA